MLAIVGISISAISSSAIAECSNSAPQERSLVDFDVLHQGLVHPWSVAFLPNEQFLIAERPGRLRILGSHGTSGKTVTNLPDLVNLFDVVTDPHFDKNSTIYIAYSAVKDRKYGLEVLRATLLDDRLVDNEVIFSAYPKIGVAPHSGGRLLFDRGGALLVSVGDRMDGLGDGQDPTSHLGTIVKLESTSPSLHRDAAIYTFGHRNVQGMALDSLTGDIWISEHGPIGGDEINVLVDGGNYGWPVKHYGESHLTTTRPIEDSTGNFVEPKYVFSPAIAPSGLAIYRNSRFPEWMGSIFIGSLSLCHLIRAEIEDGQLLAIKEVFLEGLGERIRDVRVDGNGMVYVLTDAINGKLIRIDPTVE